MLKNSIRLNSLNSLFIVKIFNSVKLGKLWLCFYLGDGIIYFIVIRAVVCKFVFENSKSNPPQIVHSLSFVHLSSALAGAAMTSPAFVLTFIASDAAVVFWSFSTIGKGLGPRGYERANNQYTLNSLSFEGQKKQKPFFPSKAAGAIQPHTKTKSTGAAFY